MKTLFKDGKIASLDSNNRNYEAIGIQDGKINFLGSEAQALNDMHSYDKVIDLEGRLVIPGLIDSHMHLLNTGYTLTKYNLNDCTSIEQLITEGREFIKEHNLTHGKWLLGRGWNQDKLSENRYPTKEDLDTISLEIPILITRTCGHIAICNSIALDMIGLEKLDPDDQNIDLEIGLFQEDALNILYNAVPSPSIDDIMNMIHNASELLIKCGVTSVQTDDLRSMPDQDYKKVIQAFEELQREKKLPVRVYQQCLFFDMPSLETFVEDGFKMGQGDDFFKIGPVKLLLDGGIGGRTALLREEYHDDPENFGISSFSQNELDKIVHISEKKGFQIAAHAIGDKAMDMFIDALKKSPFFTKSNVLRHGIVHAQITTPDLVQTIADHKLLAYVQPIFLDNEIHIIHDRIGSRAEYAYAFGSLYKEGAVTSFGTDSPVESFNPFLNIYSAVTRRDLSGQPETTYLPEERFSVLDALKAYTVNSAYSSFEEDKKGSLEIGKFADFIILSDDIFNIDPMSIKDLSVEMTIINGEIKYRKDQ